jgi:hypothetical protein
MPPTALGATSGNIFVGLWFFSAGGRGTPPPGLLTNSHGRHLDSPRPWELRHTAYRSQSAEPSRRFDPALYGVDRGSRSYAEAAGRCRRPRRSRLHRRRRPVPRHLPLDRHGRRHRRHQGLLHPRRLDLPVRLHRARRHRVRDDLRVRPERLSPVDRLPRRARVPRARQNPAAPRRHEGRHTDDRLHQCFDPSLWRCAVDGE